MTSSIPAVLSYAGLRDTCNICVTNIVFGVVSLLLVDRLNKIFFFRFGRRILLFVFEFFAFSYTGE